ncbi:MAG: 30S ribosomal protein S17 [Candidatus Pacearchaeota archaeon]
MAKEKKENHEIEKEQNQEACKDRNCPFHGDIKIRGRKFIGIIKRKNIKQKKITIEFERYIYVKKYEGYLKRFTRIHAHLPDCMINKVNIGDKVEIGETRPISKMIHHVLIRKIK